MQVCHSDKPLKQASAAETVLLKALGISPAELSVMDEHLLSFRQLFDSPLREQYLRAIASIFGKMMHVDVGRMDAGHVEVSVR
jgi:hypothetical protein